MNGQARSKSAPRRWRRLALVAAGTLAAYALAGFVLAPWIVQRELPPLLERGVHLRARVGAVRFNPFTLTLRAREFALTGADGRPLFSFAQGEVALAWRSLLRRAWILDELRFVDPDVHVEIARDGRLNLAAMVPAGGGAATAPPRLALGRLTLSNGSIEFVDARQGYRNRLDHIALDLASLSTVDAAEGSYALQGETPGGAKLRWKGSFTPVPAAASGTLAIENLALAQFAPYLNSFTTARVSAGHADLALPYRLTLRAGKPRLELQDAKLSVRGLVLQRSGAASLGAKFGAIVLDGGDFDSAAQRASLKTLHIGASSIVSGKGGAQPASIGAIAFDGAQLQLATLRGSVHALTVAGAALGAGKGASPHAALSGLALDGLGFEIAPKRVSAKALRVAKLDLALERDAGGDFELLRGLGAGAAPSATAPANWQVSIGKVDIGAASARYTDRSAKLPLALALDGLSASFGIEAASDAQGLRLNLDAGKLAVARLAASAEASARRGAAAPALRLAQLTLEGTSYDSRASALAVDAVRIGNLDARSALRSGRPSLLDLLPSSAKAGDARPLALRVKSLALDSGRVQLLDENSGIELGLDRVAGKAANLSSDKAQALSFDLAARLDSGGRLVVKGDAVPARGRLRAELAASRIALAPIQPLLARYTQLKLASGEAALAGTLRVGGKKAQLAYSGSAALTDVALDDPSGTRLIGWKSLATDALKATLAPDRIEIDELRLMGPTGRLAIAKDGSSNVSGAFAAKHEARADAAPAPEAAQPVATQPAEAGVMIRRLRVEQGALDFSDESLSPSFVAKIVDLVGTANGLTSERDARSQFSLEGRIDEFGYAHLSGSVNPFAPRERSAFRVQLRNIDLTTVSPYAMRFAGYRIASGRMSLDLNYRVRSSLIEGDNKITLDQFTLGERVESPDALKLPFELAVALLKDPDGTISLEVPVKGNLDDPQFSIAPLIWKAVGNLLGGIVAAPFRALAHLFGGAAGEAGGAIAFDPGSSRLLPPAREKIGHIAAALAKRPELKLVIPARYDAEADASALKRAAVAREIARRAGFATSQTDLAGPINLADKETRAALRALFVERNSKAALERLRAGAEAKARAAGEPAPSLAERLRHFANGDPQVADASEFYRNLWRLVREAQPLPKDALADLAAQRALAIAIALENVGVDASRIERKLAEPSAQADAKQVNLALTLAVR